MSQPLQNASFAVWAEWVTEQLSLAQVSLGHGTNQYRDEAIWLVLAANQLPLDAFDEHEHSLVSLAQAEAIVALLERRISSRQPLAYLTGEAWLQGIPLDCDARSIVPRSLIAELIAQGDFDDWLSTETQRVLDICTGNGSLAILAAMAWPEVSVVGCDLSPDALALAAQNVQKHQLTQRISLYQGHLLEPLANQAPFDLVLCNPPYVNLASMQALPPEFLAEPRMALDGNTAGNADGMDLLRELLPTLPRLMHDHAILVLEIGHEMDHFLQAFPGLPVLGLPTSAGDEQVVLITATDLRQFVSQ